MKKTVALAALSALALAACKDNTQAQLEQQQKQIEALQQQLAQQNGGQQDNTVYQLTPEGVKDTIPAEAQANGNNGQPVTGTDGQQYIYDQSSGSWLLQSLIGTAAGAFIGPQIHSGTQPKQPHRTTRAHQLLSVCPSEPQNHAAVEHPQPARAKPCRRHTQLPPNHQNAAELPPSRHARRFRPPPLIKNLKAV